MMKMNKSIKILKSMKKIAITTILLLAVNSISFAQGF